MDEKTETGSANFLVPFDGRGDGRPRRLQLELDINPLSGIGLSKVNWQGAYETTCPIHPGAEIVALGTSTRESRINTADILMSAITSARRCESWFCSATFSARRIFVPCSRLREAGWPC